MPSDDPWELQQLVERYKFRCEVLETEIAGLKDCLNYVKGGDLQYAKAYHFFKLTKKEHIVFCALMARDLISRGELMNRLYSLAIDDPPGEKIIDVFVCKLRAKLKRYRAPIGVKFGVGYFIAPKDKELIKNLLESVTDSDMFLSS